MMRAIAAALALSLSGLPASSFAEEPNSLESSAGNLRILHVWTTDPEGFVRTWSQPTPPQLEISTQTERNKPIQQFILYANCTRDDEGMCYLSARVTIAAPDGTPYGEPMQFDAFPRGKPVPWGNIGMAPNSIGMVIEDGEQLGTYRVELAVTDEVSDLTATHVAEIEVAEASIAE